MIDIVPSHSLRESRGGIAPRSRCAYVSSLDELRSLQRLDLPPERWLTSDILAYNDLSSSGHDVIGTWEYLDGVTRKMIVLEATRLKECWCDDFRSQLSYRGLDMGKAAKFSVYYFLFEALASAHVARAFFNSERVGSLALEKAGNTAVKYGLAEVSSVPHAIMAGVAQRSGIPVHFNTTSARGSRPDWHRLFRTLVPRSLRRARSALLEQLKNRRQRKAGAHQLSHQGLKKWLHRKTPSHRTALVASIYQGFLMLLPVAEVLESADERWSTLRVHTGFGLNYAGMKDDSRYADFLPENPQPPFEYVELRSWNRGGRSHEAFVNGIWNSFSSRQKHYRGAYPEIFANVGLNFQFRHLLMTEVAQLCNLADAAFELIEQVHPDVLLVGNGGDGDRILAAVARQLDIPTVLMPHNRTWAFPELYDYPVDYIAVRNAVTAELLRPLVPDSQVLVAGDLKPCTARRTQIAAAPTSRGQTSLLVLTGGAFPGVFQYFRTGSLDAALRELLSAVASQTDWNLVFRPHPRGDVTSLIETLIAQSPDAATGRASLNTVSLAEELIPSADIVVMLEYSSSPILAAWEAGVPIVRWTADGLFYGPNDMFQDEWFPQVQNCGQLRDVVERFKCDEKYRHTWIQKGYALAGAFTTGPNLANGELTRLIEGVCRRRAA